MNFKFFIPSQRKFLWHSNKALSSCRIFHGLITAYNKAVSQTLKKHTPPFLYILSILTTHQEYCNNISISAFLEGPHYAPISVFSSADAQMSDSNLYR